MQNIENLSNITVVWRGNKYVVEMKSDASLKDLGDELQKLTDVKSDTLRLIVPQFSSKSSKLLSPFSDEHSRLSLQEASIVEGKSIRMMGVSEDEVDKVLQNAKMDLRIAGFDEEENRIRRRTSRSPPLIQLPQGPYIFCDFRTLELPGVELNPPASEALKRMHMLAADPGIVAIMNKHRWRVGIMTEMAPVGYVGISPKCILGFNKNHGEEISLRLRTDDLKGFRKYESIKKTLLHELAHMVFSEHDANFYALDKQLNQEAANLDWTKSRGHSLSGTSHIDHHDEDNLNDDDYVADSKSVSHKLGGNVPNHMESAREASVVAAYQRLANASTNSSRSSNLHEEPDPDDSMFNVHDESDAMDYLGNESTSVENPFKAQNDNEPDPDELSCDQWKCKPDSSVSDHNYTIEVQPTTVVQKPDPDDAEAKQQVLGALGPNNGSSVLHPNYANEEPDPDDCKSHSVAHAEPDPDDNLLASQEISSMQNDEPDPDDKELQRIQDPVTVICGRLQRAIETMRAEVSLTEATTALETLLKIIRNLINHPDNMKFKRLRKANPLIQKTIAIHQAAMEILLMVGFIEEAAFDQIGRSETYLVLKRNDPGLLWLAKSSLEKYVAL